MKPRGVELSDHSVDRLPDLACPFIAVEKGEQAIKCAYPDRCAAFLPILIEVSTPRISFMSIQTFVPNVAIRINCQRPQGEVNTLF